MHIKKARKYKMINKNIYIILLIILPILLIAQAFDGMVLLNTMNSNTARLINNNGQIIKTWYCNSGVAYVPYLMTDSTMWRPGAYSGATMRGAAYGGLIQQYNWNGTVIRNFIWSAQNHQQHHDIHPMPNGNILLVSWDRKTRAEAQALGRQSINSDMWPDAVIEYDPVADSVVWEWHAWDHLIQDVDPSKPNYGIISEHPERLNINLGSVQGGDWMHCNTVDYNAERDEIILTSHNLHEIYVIDHSATTLEAAGSTGGRHGKGGDFIYRWGNPQNYGRGTTADRKFYVVHGANWIRNGMPGAGNIIVLNNGDRSGTANDYSEILEITAPLDSADHYYISPDSAFGPTTPTWSYSNGSAFYSQHLGGAYRLSNGNTFAILGTAGRLVEITSTGQVVWQYNAGAQIGRALKYPINYFTAVEENAVSEVNTSNIFLNITNPFINSSTIRYNLHETGRVKITIYNSVGCLVNTLLDETKNSGAHTTIFSAGSSMPTGLYFVRFEVNTNNKQYFITKSVIKEK
jgi:hypothetical protein